MSQLVELWTEKPGAILMQVWFHNVTRDFSSSQLSMETHFIQPPYAMACIDMCTHFINPKHWEPYHRLDT